MHPGTRNIFNSFVLCMCNLSHFGIVLTINRTHVYSEIVHSENAQERRQKMQEAVLVLTSIRARSQVLRT